MSETENDSQQTTTRQPLARSGFRRRAFRKVIVLSLIAIATLTVLSMTATRPDTLGVRKGKLAALPESPNCVSTMAERASQKIETINVAGIDKPLEKLKQVIAEKFPRAELTFGERNYLCYEFTSLIFRFVDDVEFVLIENELHFRSASRVGYSDLGANRKRMEKIRAAMK